MRLTKEQGRALLAKKPKQNKYRNKPIVVDGRRYASQREAEVCEGLILDEEVGKIGGLELQPRFQILGPKGDLICVYVADAAFYDHEQDRFRVVDVKGVETKEFKIKKRLMKSLKGIDVEIIR